MPSIPQLKKLLALEPADPFTLYALAQEHAKAGNTDQAVLFYDRCLAADPAYCYAYYHKAKALADAGRNQDAAETTRRGITAATSCNDAKALAELSSLLDQLE